MKLYRIFLPKRYNDGREIGLSRIREVAEKLKEKFGGYTLNPQAYLPLMEGVWTEDNTNEVYTEPMYCIELFTQDTFDNQKWMKAFTEMIRQDLKQKQLFVIVQNAEIIM